MGFDWEWLSGSESKNDIRADRVRPFVTQYQRLNGSSDFHEIRCRSFFFFTKSYRTNSTFVKVGSPPFLYFTEGRE